MCILKKQYFDNSYRTGLSNKKILFKANLSIGITILFKKHTRLKAVVTPIERPKSFRNRCVFKFLGDV